MLVAGGWDGIRGWYQDDVPCSAVDMPAAMYRGGGTRAIDTCKIK